MPEAMQSGAFVLHLARAEKRRENALQLRDSCGLAGEVWPAIDGARLTSSERAAVVRAQLFDPPYPFALKTGEIGCFLGHRQIWAEIVRRGLDHALVFEDDVTLDVSVFDQALDLAAQHIATYGYIQLQNRPAKDPGALIDRAGSCTMTLPVVTPLRASAQMISGAAARRLLDMSQRFDRPVDTFVQSHWHTGLRPAVIYPAGVRTISDQLDGSTIQMGRKSRWEKLRREIARFRYRRAVQQFSHGSSAPDHKAAP